MRGAINLYHLWWHCLIIFFCSWNVTCQVPDSRAISEAWQQLSLLGGSSCRPTAERFLSKWWERSAVRECGPGKISGITYPQWDIHSLFFRTSFNQDRTFWDGWRSMQWESERLAGHWHDWLALPGINTFMVSGQLGSGHRVPLLLSWLGLHSRTTE